MLPVISSLEHLQEALHHADKVRVIHPRERKLQKAMAKAFKAQGKSFMRGFIKYKDYFPPEVKESSPLKPLLRFAGSMTLKEVLTIDELAGLFDQSDSDSFEAFLTPLSDAVKAILLASGLSQVAELGLGLNFDLKNPRAVAYIKAHGAELVTKINEETRSLANTILTQAADEGWSYQDTARKLIALYDGFGADVPYRGVSNRAQFITVTELGNAYEEGNFEPIQDLMDRGIEMEKFWDTAPELSKSGPCEECQANNAEGWIPADQSHASGDDHPLAHPICYCDELYRVKGA